MDIEIDENGNIFIMNTSYNGASAYHLAKKMAAKNNRDAVKAVKLE